MSLLALYDLPAPAKLNLFLHVVGRRPDGMHLLQSVFVLVDWCDSLHFERRDDGRTARHDLGPALPADDLCLRAARALQAAAGTAFGVDISIDKRVPWGAGMGGGSSDAATTLLTLNRLWGLHWPRARLAEIGLRLGADVPFFIGGENAFVEGVGEKLTPLVQDGVPPDWYAVVKPAASIDTGSIFADPALVRDTASVMIMGSLARDGYGRNDLQQPAEAKCPEVARAASWLMARYGNSRMTGSGSAVFARAGSGDEPAAALDIGALPAGWVGRMCKGLAVHPLRGWATSG